MSTATSIALVRLGVPRHSTAGPHDRQPPSRSSFWPPPRTPRERPSGRTPPSSRSGTERPRATFVPYATREAAARATGPGRPYFRSLNGDVAVPLGEEPLRRARRASRQPAFDDGAWDAMPVPSNWQVVGANEGRPYDRPFFTNIKHPFKADPPRVPHDDNPVGLYRTSFERAGRVERPSRVRALRGRAVGLLRLAQRPEDRLPRGCVHARRVRPDARTSARARTCWPSRCIHHSDGSYLEDQDYWRLAGIFRDVYLVAQPTVRLRDFVVAHRPRRRVSGRDAGRARVASRTGPARRRGRPHGPRDRCWGRTAGRSSRRRSASGRPIGRRGRGSALAPSARPGARVSGPRRRLTSTRSCSSISTGPARSRRPPRTRIGFRKVEIKGGQTAAQRRGDHVQGRQPARVRSGSRARRVPRAHARGHPPDEALQLQRRAHVALSERPALARPLRRAGPVRRRRGERREPRAVGAEDLHRATTRPGRTRSSPAASRWSSATRTTRRSSSGRWGTRPASGATSTPCTRP